MFLFSSSENHSQHGLRGDLAKRILNKDVVFLDREIYIRLIAENQQYDKILHFKIYKIVAVITVIFIVICILRDLFIYKILLKNILFLNNSRIPEDMRSAIRSFIP